MNTTSNQDPTIENVLLHQYKDSQVSFSEAGKELTANKFELEALLPEGQRAQLGTLFSFENSTEEKAFSFYDSLNQVKSNLKGLNVKEANEFLSSFDKIPDEGLYFEKAAGLSTKGEKIVHVSFDFHHEKIMAGPTDWTGDYHLSRVNLLTDKGQKVVGFEGLLGLDIDDKATLKGLSPIKNKLEGTSLAGSSDRLKLFLNEEYTVLDPSFPQKIEKNLTLEDQITISAKKIDSLSRSVNKLSESSYQAGVNKRVMQGEANELINAVKNVEKAEHKIADKLSQVYKNPNQNKLVANWENTVNNPAAAGQLHDRFTKKRFGILPNPNQAELSAKISEISNLIDNFSDRKTDLHLALGARHHGASKEHLLQKAGERIQALKGYEKVLDLNAKRTDLRAAKGLLKKEGQSLKKNIEKFLPGKNPKITLEAVFSKTANFTPVGKTHQLASLVIKSLSQANNSLSLDR